MEIIKTESWVLRVPFTPTSADVDDAHHELIGVTIHTNTHSGMGYAFITDTVGGSSVKELLDTLLLPALTGRSVFDVQRIWQEFFLLTHRMGAGFNRFAMAAVDIALWDLRAKTNGLSLAQELGQLTDTVPVYGSGKAGTRLSTDELVDLSVGYVRDGFDAVKIRVGQNTNDDVDRVGSVRAAVGPAVRIMVDANERLDLPTALSLGARIAEHDIFWFEEPVLSTDLRAHRVLADKLPMPIVGGEHHCSAAEFVPYVEAGAFRVLQPNACMVGGITEIMRIARLAELHGVGFAPHLMTELHVHVAAATTSTTYVEYFPFLEPYITRPVAVADGVAHVPTNPGHGIEFTDDAMTRYRTA